MEFIAEFPNSNVQDAAAEEGIRTVTFRNERVAVGAACGYTHASLGKQIGVSSVMLGPGIECAFPTVRRF